MRCWRIIVGDVDARARRALFALLNEDERGRAHRFVRDADRLSFTAAHGGLRLVLAAVLHAPPAELSFAQGLFGKPALAGHDDVQFNMSHSGGVVLIAVACGTPVGADVEAIRPLPDRADIVRRFLHPGEAADMAGLAEADAEQAFFRCWSRKEAVVKALGLGMSLDLGKYRVSCRAGVAPALLELDGEAAPSEWSLVDLDRPGPAHVGAVAARRKSLAVSCRTFDPAVALRD